MIVIDAGVSIDWFLPNPNELVKVALDRVAEEGAVVPALWRWEVHDVLRRFAQHGRLTQSAEYVRASVELAMRLQVPLATNGGALQAAVKPRIWNRS